MQKNAAVATVGLILAAAAVWLVRTQAESYRAALNRHRLHAATAHAADPGEREPGRAAVPPPAPPGTDAADRPAVGPASDRPARVTKPSAAERPADAATTPAPPGPAPASVPYVSPVKFRPLVIAGLEDATAAEEAAFGKLLFDLIKINHTLVEDLSPGQKAFERALPPLLDLRERKDVEVTGSVLDADEVNAFSHMGGFVYLSRGLFNFIATEEEFLFVVGHELAHVDLKHGQALAAELTRDGTVKTLGSVQAMYHQIATGYTDAQEFAADDWVVDRMRRLGRTTRECLTFLRKFKRYADEQKFARGHVAPKSPPQAPVQDVENHYRAQPPAFARLGRLEARLNAAPARPGAGAK